METENIEKKKLFDFTKERFLLGLIYIASWIMIFTVFMTGLWIFAQVKVGQYECVETAKDQFLARYCTLKPADDLCIPLCQNTILKPIENITEICKQVNANHNPTRSLNWTPYT